MSHQLVQINDLSRTKAAIEAYDRLDEEFHTLYGTFPSQGVMLALLDRLDEAGKAVAAAFELDTADRNGLGSCASVRPGPKMPRPGAQLSFVRQAVQRWESR